MTNIVQSRGNTKVAQYLDKKSQSKQDFQQSATLGKQTAYDELLSVWEACKTSNWDGEDALPVEEATFINTYCFINALPLGCPLPSVGVEPDGHLTLEWYQHPRWTLSISISPESVLYYAALFGNNDVRGSEIFFGEIPKNILHSIQQVYMA